MVLNGNVMVLEQVSKSWTNNTANYVHVDRQINLQKTIKWPELPLPGFLKRDRQMIKLEYVDRQSAK
jgi:hypothetical protein